MLEYSGQGEFYILEDDRTPMMKALDVGPGEYFVLRYKGSKEMVSDYLGNGKPIKFVFGTNGILQFGNGIAPSYSVLLDLVNNMLIVDKEIE